MHKTLTVTSVKYVTNNNYEKKKYKGKRSFSNEKYARNSTEMLIGTFFIENVIWKLAKFYAKVDTLSSTNYNILTFVPLSQSRFTQIIMFVFRFHHWEGKKFFKLPNCNYNHIKFCVMHTFIGTLERKSWCTLCNNCTNFID